MTTRLLDVKTLAPSHHPGVAGRLRALEAAISAPRLSTDLRYAHHNVRLALELYEWNIRAAAGLLPILQVNEIALRNGVNRALVAAFGEDWPFSNGFVRALPRRDRDSFLDVRGRLERELQRRRVSTGDVVAAQSYWFWVSMLTRRFENRIWKRHFATAFPHAPARVGRETVHAMSDEIRKLRNRIAHHEPLMRYDLVGAYKRAISIVRWISPEMASWAEERWPPGSDLILPR